MRRKQCVAMLLAGGEGRRLGALTKNLAKPAVHFGGKYRIIDFTLSNCTNSGIDTVGILTQYRPLVLNSYIGIGSSWDLDRKNGGVTVLPPFMEQKGGNWYSGTANAIYRNIEFIEQYDPEYVLVISGDHIYKMNYDAMLSFHKDQNAEATIAVLEVKWEEASRFGILSVNDSHDVTEFAEKPKVPLSNLASMGIYIFNWSLLKSYLTMDEANPESSNDFGKDLIPSMLRDKMRIKAYPFEGYWKDVGTIQSLWESNMDLLEEKTKFDLFDRDWRIYSKSPYHPPQYISPTAKVTRSLVNEGCFVYGDVHHSVLFYGVNIGKGAMVRDSVIMPNVTIEEGARVYRAIIGEGTVVKAGAVVGDPSADAASEITLIGNNETVQKGVLA
jgi:glucose-1-phosphate adenylyltransferase